MYLDSVWHLKKFDMLISLTFLNLRSLGIPESKVNEVSSISNWWKNSSISCTLDLILFILLTRDSITSQMKGLGFMTVVEGHLISAQFEAGVFSRAGLFLCQVWGQILVSFLGRRMVCLEHPPRGVPTTVFPSTESLDNG